MEIRVYCTLKEMKTFLIESTCKNFIPMQYIDDNTIFIERKNTDSKIHVEAEKKEDVTEIGEISFVKAENIIGIFYNSKSGNTNLKWRQLYGELGKLTGTCSNNTSVNLFSIGIRNIETITEKSEDENGSSENN